MCRKALEGSAAYRGAGLLDAAGSLELRDGEKDSRLFAGGGFAAPAITGAPIVDAGLLPSPALQRGPYRLIGQVRDSYIVAEGPDGLVLVDQHAAHERVIYNRLVAAREAHERRMRNLQPLLVPVVLYLTGAQAATLGQFRDSLAEAGLEIEDFGSGSARLIACDPQVPEQGIDRLAIDVLDSLTSEGPRQDLTRQLEKATYTIACHSAIRFGQRLSSEEMQGLLRDLEVTDPGITCPHGRPTILEISEARLRREFKRN
jgi:DNA mismatch repair protein MutL